MSSAAASKRALLAEDVHGERLLVVIGPCQGSTRTRFSFSPNALPTHPNPIGEGFATQARLEAAGPECIIPGQITPLRILGVKDMRGLNVSFDQSSSFSSNDTDQQFRFVEPAYSFVGMHCVFDNCKASVIQQLKGPSKGITAPLISSKNNNNDDHSNSLKPRALDIVYPPSLAWSLS
ncbi:hypothetical protein HPP92_010050 [Vanilla planifolia]|uniref:Uncharacterized protein n=1 Tax=Vanilla planifolia TaxID=51239 RepID=A0A835R3C0_VANPL|nr:hypothetical protein HPP92_010050 [Vanilla planifolia]